MNYLQPKLHLKLVQKQILTPGLVQMVSVLALNRLELREMINQEMIANPVKSRCSICQPYSPHASTGTVRHTRFTSLHVRLS